MNGRPLRVVVVEDDPDFGAGFSDNFSEAYRKLRRDGRLAFTSWSSYGAAEIGLRMQERYDVAFCDFWLHPDKGSLPRLKLDRSPTLVEESDGFVIAKRLAERSEALALMSATTIFREEPAVRNELNERFGDMRKRGRFETFEKTEAGFHDRLAKWVCNLPLLK